MKQFFKNISVEIKVSIMMIILILLSLLIINITGIIYVK